MTISQAFKSYRDDVISFKNQSPKTEENHYIAMRSLVSFLGDVQVETITFDMVRNWKIELEKKRSPETVRNYIIKLRVVLEYLREKGIDVLKPNFVPVPKRGDKIPDFISEQEVSRLISGTKVIRNKAIISLLYASGIRVSELTQLDRGSIIDSTFTIMGKGKRARLCFIDERTRTLLDLYLESRTDNSPALFTGKFDSRRITSGNVQEIFRIARKAAGFTRPIHPHTMRHSFATNLLRNNANMRYVQALLGHSSLETTQMYTHVVDVDLQKAYNTHHTV